MQSFFSRRFLALTFLLAATSAAAWATINVSPQSQQFGSINVGQSFSQQFFANTQGVTWSITQGLLPPGITLNSATGVISGTASGSGFYVWVLQATSASDTGTGSYEINIIGGALSLNVNTLNQRVSTNSALNVQLGAVGGVPPYTWSFAPGTISNGLSISTTGVVSGTPITPGVTTLNIVLRDSGGTTAEAQVILFVLGITTLTLPPAPLNTAYSQTLQVSGAQVPVTWSISGPTPLPPGFSLSAQGILAGFPTVSGVYTFSVTATDFIQNTATVRYTLAVGASFSITTSTLPNAAIGVSYSQVLQAAGGVVPYTWSATGLPAGLTLNASTGTLQGTPTTVGTQSIAVTATDASLATTRSNLVLTVDPLSISTNTLPPGIVGVSYSAGLNVAGGQPQLTWAILNGSLPPGLALNSSSGAINGTPTTSGNYPFNATVTYGATGVIAQKPLSIQVSVPSGLIISTGASLPSGSINAQYSQTLAATGGRPPYTWALLSGSLPTGLTFSSNGAIAGTPLGVGTANFTIGVTDSVQAFVNQAFSLTVLPSALDFTNALRIPQVVDGGNFITQFAIANLDALPVSYQFRFWGDNGAPLNIPILNGAPGTVSGTIQPGGIAFAQTTGTSAAPGTPALQGWAEVAATGRVGVTAIFRRSIAGFADSEATVTGAVSGGAVSLPFDNTQGYATGIALANTSALNAISITAVFQFENGGSASQLISLPPHGHTAFVLPIAYAATAGLRGVVHFTAFSPDISAVGLRFSPNNSFTALGAFQ